jgi:hypothetical protein
MDPTKKPRGVRIALMHGRMISDRDSQMTENAQLVSIQKVEENT